MPIGEVVEKWPNTAEVFAKHGMHCVGCAIASFESIQQGAEAHGMDLGKLMKDLNEVAKKKGGK
ncbi:MAG: DUF1858 domain-containing protein [Nanoarchaeota archaeon]|nr:DUF1858 domain-containing protein [Nanoarchaeota archaeon]MBU4352717.1 DUF1858 domain-containing protein [Nanoarchaeota archaeon]